MILRLNPRFPLLWRSPQSLQLGVDDPIVFDDVTPVEERILELLVRGASPDALDVLAAEAGGDADDRHRVLERVAGRLVAEKPVAVPTVTITGDGRGADLTADALSASGVAVRRAGASLELAAAPADLAVAFCHFTPAPVLHGLWLRRDIPHLTVVAADRFTAIGPLIEPGCGPCLHCLHRRRSDTDSAWPALATQLHGRAAGFETAASALQSAALAARLVLDRLGATRGMSGVAGVSGVSTAGGVRGVDASDAVGRVGGRLGVQHLIDVETGRIEEREVPAHPECLCADEMARHGRTPIAGDAVMSAGAPDGAVPDEPTPRWRMLRGPAPSRWAVGGPAPSGPALSPRATSPGRGPRENATARDRPVPHPPTTAPGDAVPA